MKILVFEEDGGRMNKYNVTGKMADYIQNSQIEVSQIESFIFLYPTDAIYLWIGSYYMGILIYLQDKTISYFHLLEIGVRKEFLCSL